MTVWTLPEPPKEPEIVWHPVVRVARVIPFGYKVSEDDPDILDPIPEELVLLEEAKKHLKQYSYRQVAAWLSKESGRSISHYGLIKRVKSEQKRNRQASIQRRLERQAKEAAEKAEKLEKRIGGCQTREVDSGGSEG